jgi:hypothetical protein
MSGVTAPPSRSRLYLATSKVRDKSIASFQASSGRSAIPPIADVSLRGSEPPLRAKKRLMQCNIIGPMFYLRAQKQGRLAAVSPKSDMLF